MQEVFFVSKGHKKRERNFFVTFPSFFFPFPRKQKNKLFIPQRAMDEKKIETVREELGGGGRRRISQCTTSQKEGKVGNIISIKESTRSRVGRGKSCFVR